MASVISGGLRARRHANLRQGLSASLRQAAILGAAVYLLQLPCQALSGVIRWARTGLIPLQFGSFEWSYFLSGALALLIIAAVWSGRRRLIIAAGPVQLAIATAAPFALVCALVWLLRQRTRTSPPTPS